MSNKIKSYGKLSKEEFDALKKDHKDIFTLSVFFEEENGDVVELYAYLKKPDRSTISLALANIDRDPLRAKEILLAKSWLKGDERIKTNDDAFLSAASVLDGLLTVRSASLKKN